jgi:type II secretory pathway pseudopilin PulG
LIELMVVVAIISIFAAIAVPAMLSSSDDRRAFELSHRTAQLFQSARARALATGSAHLVVMTTSGFGAVADRGTFQVYQGYYNTVSGTGAPTANCNLAGQWAALSAVAPAPFPVGPTAVLVDGLNYQYSADATLRSQFKLNGALTTGADVVCFTPGGRVYYAPTAAGLTTAGPLSQPFEVQLRRYATAAGEGLTRSVMINGSDTARVRSF